MVNLSLCLPCSQKCLVLLRYDSEEHDNILQLPLQLPQPVPLQEAKPLSTYQKLLQTFKRRRSSISTKKMTRIWKENCVWQPKNHNKNVAAVESRPSLQVWDKQPDHQFDPCAVSGKISYFLNPDNGVICTTVGI